MFALDFEKFPEVILNSLKKKYIKFPDNIEVTYDDFKAYRVIKRKPTDSLTLNCNDFMSQIEECELNPNLRGVDKYNIANYSCSVFTNSDVLINAMHMPRKNRRIIKGYIKHKNGVVQKECSSHVNCWLYKEHTMHKDFEVLNG